MNTTEPMPQEQLDAIQRRVESATEGPWSHWSGFDQRDNCIKSDTDEGMYTVAEVVSEASDARFVARAREDVPALLAEVERLRAQPTVDKVMVERVARALCNMHSDPWTWDEATEIRRDYWRKDARAALDAALNPEEVK